MSQKIETIEVDPIHAAIVEAACLAMMIDGEVHERELEHLHHFIAALLEVEEDVADLMLANAMQQVQAAHIDDFLDALPARVPEIEDQERLLFAVMITEYVDGVLTLEEEGLVYAMANRFGLEDDHLDEITLQARQTFLQFTPSNEPMN